MPNMSGHMAIAKRVSDILNIKDKDFYIGNLLPDLYLDKKISHYKIQGKKYLIPDTNYYINNKDLSNKKNLGYLCHLLLDKYYLEEYLMDIEDNVFESDTLYKDYDILNKDIVKYFNLDVPYILDSLNYIEDDIEKSKLETNITCLQKNEVGQTYYLEKDKFIKFLDDISIIIAKEVEKYAS